MKTNGNNKKDTQLGIPHGTASNQLRKMIMFQLIQETGKDICYRCGMAIENIDNLSIEHKVPWLDSVNPKELFFDLENIAFSHIDCNRNAVRREYLKENGIRWGKSNTISVPEGTKRCSNCKKSKPVSDFSKNKSNWTGLQDECKECTKKRRIGAVA